MSTIAFIGLGNMGRPMVSFLLKAGHELRIYARRSDVFHNEASHLIEAGAVTCSSPAEAAIDAEFIITNVTSTQDVADVLYSGKNAIIETANPGAICIDHSTIDPQGTKDIANVMATKGVSYVDAPVSGGAQAAKEAKLVMMLGGTDADVARVREIVKSYAITMTHVGGVGHGQVAKLCHQIAQIVNLQGIAESIRFAAANGADLQKVFEAISGGMAGSRMLELMGPKMIQRDFKAGIEARLHAKDLFLIKDAAKKNDLDLPALETVAVQLEKIMSLGWGSNDTCSLLKLLE